METMNSRSGKRLKRLFTWGGVSFCACCLVGACLLGIVTQRTALASDQNQHVQSLLLGFKNTYLLGSPTDEVKFPPSNEMKLAGASFLLALGTDVVCLASGGASEGAAQVVVGAMSATSDVLDVYAVVERSGREGPLQGSKEIVPKAVEVSAEWAVQWGGKKVGLAVSDKVPGVRTVVRGVVLITKSLKDREVYARLVQEQRRLLVSAGPLAEQAEAIRTAINALPDSPQKGEYLRNLDFMITKGVQVMVYRNAVMSELRELQIEVLATTIHGAAIYAHRWRKKTLGQLRDPGAASLAALVQDYLVGKVSRSGFEQKVTDYIRSQVEHPDEAFVAGVRGDINVRQRLQAIDSLAAKMSKYGGGPSGDRMNSYAELDQWVTTQFDRMRDQLERYVAIINTAMAFIEQVQTLGQRLKEFLSPAQPTVDNSRPLGAIVFCVDGMSFTATGTKILAPDAAIPQERRQYLSASLEQMGIGLGAGNIVTFSWDGNALRSPELLGSIVAEMRKAYIRAKGENKKFIVVGHSWGTVLAYMALAKAAAESSQDPSKQPVIADLFVTLSSPMGTAKNTPFVIRIGKSLEPELCRAAWGTIKNFTDSMLQAMGIDALRSASGLKAVRRWVNYWAQGDMISGPLGGLKDLPNIGAPVEDCRIGPPIYATSLLNTFDWHRVTTANGGAGIVNPLHIPYAQKMQEALKQEILRAVGVNEVTPRGVDIALVIDTSASMQGSKLTSAQRAASLLVGLSQGRDRLSLVGFATRADLISPPLEVDPQNSQETRNRLNRLLQALRASGNTNMGAGLKLALSQIQKGDPAAPRAIVLLSDGKDNKGELGEAVRILSKSQVRVYTVGLGGQTDARTLRQIAHLTNGRYFEATDANLQQIYELINTHVRGASQLLKIIDFIRQDQLKEFVFIVKEGMTKLSAAVSWQGSKVGLTLVSPSGRVIDDSSLAGVSRSSTGTHTILRVERPEPGHWKVKVKGVEIPPQGEPFDLAVSVDCKIAIAPVGHRERYSVGKPVRLGVVLTDKRRSQGWQPFQADVSAVVYMPNGESKTIRLYDDGRHQDRAANDGFYANLAPESRQRGLHRVEYQIVSPQLSGGKRTVHENYLAGERKDLDPDRYLFPN